ncbi:MAG: hypothetical protein ACOZCL_00655 [Bacillota bacterium]
MKLKSTLQWQIGAAFIGTIIGAGFASGQEIMFFFTQYGLPGSICMLLTGLVFSLLSYAVIYCSAYFSAHNYNDLINRLCGKRLALVYDIIISSFLFLGVSIMFSGSGAVFKENLGLPSFVGISLIAVFTLLVVFSSVKGILRLNTVIVPILIGIIVLIFCQSIGKLSVTDIVSHMNQIKPESVHKPFFSFLFYCSYNVVLSIGVLSAFSENIKDIGILKKGALIGGAGLMLLGSLQNICIAINAPNVFRYSIPMLYVIKQYNVYFKYLVTICIWCAVFTTAVSNLFSIVKRISRGQDSSYKLTAAIITASCIPLSLYDFKKLVSFFYPLFGALSILLIAILLITFIRLRFSAANSIVRKNSIVQGHPPSKLHPR